MIVYRDRRREVDAADVLTGLRRAVARLAPYPPHDAVVRILIELGMLESGVADARHPDADDEEEMGRTLRAAALAAGHLLRLSWHGWLEEPGRWRNALEGRLGELDGGELPARTAVEIPEGYAQYGLFPECYLAAAERCAAERDGAYVCIGLRSIGTGLSAVVAAGLEARGCTVRSYTLRPRGHPFDRRPVLGPALARELAQARGHRFLIVDEGPGISGSSFAGTADALGRLGIPDEDIVLLPSWDTDSAALRSEAARRRWGRHTRVVCSFEEVWVDSGRLASGLGARSLRDISAGGWRDVLLPPGHPRPVVQPQHERRKFLDDDLLLSFAGLGGLAEQRLERGRALAEAGFGPAPVDARHGFLVRAVAPGVPLRRGEADGSLVDLIGRYLAHLQARYSADPSPSGALEEMVEVNVGEALGVDGAAMLARHRRVWGRLVTERSAALDARMQPHEWIRSQRGWLKVDALDHHDDHFMPGLCDIAWDLAAAGIELGLDPAGRRRLLERYRRASGDRDIATRLPAYDVAYLAYRVGYATTAAETLGTSDDGRGFAALARRYTRRLRRELAGTAVPVWTG